MTTFQITLTAQQFIDAQDVLLEKATRLEQEGSKTTGTKLIQERRKKMLVKAAGLRETVREININFHAQVQRDNQLAEAQKAFEARA